MRVSRVQTLLGGAALACFTCGFMTAQTPSRGNPEAAKIQNPVPAAPVSIGTGKQVFQRYCVNCHGQNGKGLPSNREEAPPGPDLTDNKWDHGSSDGEIFYVIKNGVQPDLFMEPWDGRISDIDIWNVVNYIRSLGPTK